MALWGQLTTTSPTPTARVPACTPFELPSGGAIVYNDTYTSTLTAKLTFQQPCDDLANLSASDPGASGNSTVIGLHRDPFYASTSPQIFAIATASVISYLLVIIIFITPRTFLVGGLGGASSTGFLSRSANAPVVGVGRRPWLQKIATVTVAVSLTIATADTFRVAKEQYDMGYTDATALVDDVVGSLEIRIVRVISDTFLWLAQVQTLIRLFPRHKEKVTIKWLGFALVSLDTIFSVLDNFVNQSIRTRPRSFQDAIPALNYLFELAISLIYASCVIYYSLSKRRFAFWHKRMRNICLVALLSLMAILIPVVFFVLDVSKPDVAGWGDYIRWVGAAAASVVVWEWVERIEALERDERKDGILGREIFDGDEMLDDPTAEQADFPGRREYWNRHGFPTEDRDPADAGAGGIQMRALRSRIPFANRSRSGNARTAAEGNAETPGAIVESDITGQVARPAQAVSPVSRSDSASAGSTIYAIRYHTMTTPTVQSPTNITEQLSRPESVTNLLTVLDPSTSGTVGDTLTSPAAEHATPIIADNVGTTPQNASSGIRTIPVWRTVPNPFKRRRSSPPAEVAAQIAEGGARRSPAERNVGLRERFASARWTRANRAGARSIPDTTAMAVTVIPAQPRAPRTWLPDQDGEQEVPVDNEEQEQPALDPRRQTPDNLSQAGAGQSPLSGLDDQEMSVLVIPAPRRGQRTWSPEDAYTGPVLQPPVPSPISDSPDGPSIRPPVISTRGTLTISEDQARSQLRSTYARNSPVYSRAPQSDSAASQATRSLPTAHPRSDRDVESDPNSSASSSGTQSMPDIPVPSTHVNSLENDAQHDEDESDSRQQ